MCAGYLLGLHVLRLRLGLLGGRFVVITLTVRGRDGLSLAFGRGAAGLPSRSGSASSGALALGRLGSGGGIGG